MKRIILCVIALMNGLFVYSQTSSIYKFPIKQGSKEWERVKSINKRIELLQIPDTILKKISTEDLLETSLQFPYLTDILFADNFKRGFEVLTEEFNGFRELLKRQDLTNVLLNKYRNISSEITSIKFQSAIEQGKFSFRHFVLEFLLEQDIVLNNLNLEQEKQLFFLSFEHKKIKNSNAEIFSNLNLVPTHLLYAKKIINDTNYKFESAEQKEVILNFIQIPVYIDPQIIDKIETYIKIKFKL
jgi:hypothetical protein